MALRTIRTEGDPVLTKQCRTIDKMTARLRTLAEDMLDTMYEANGVGLAAPQVGVLKRMEQTGDEGCLSVPGMAGQVTRPNHVIVKALDIDLNPIQVEGEELLARALCHEIDHLSGKLYTSLVEGELHPVTYEEEEEEANE